MTAPWRHAHEVPIDVALLRLLLSSQFPSWAELPIERVDSSGTDNAMYRLGDDLVARLPRILDSSWQVDKEHRWLPLLAPHLSLDVPELLGQGEPGEGFPFAWSIYRWLEGEEATTAKIADSRSAATRLGHFVAALAQIDPGGGPLPGDHNFWRGCALRERDIETREALMALEGAIDTDAAAAAWDAALDVPTWQDPPVWIHGDLYAGNLLAHEGVLSAVIDFGALGVGDPACDVMAAWTYCSPDTRDAFRAALPSDDATWARGRGWALSAALIGLPYYRDTNPEWTAIASRIIDDVLADQP